MAYVIMGIYYVFLGIVEFGRAVERKLFSLSSELVRLKEFVLRKGLLYAEGHVWLKPLALSRIRVGMDDFASKLLSGAEFLKLPAPGTRIVAGQPCAVVSCQKGWKADLSFPVTGTVVQVNRKLQERKGDLLNKDPYRSGWLVVVEPEEPFRPERYLSGDQAKQWLLGEIDRFHTFLTSGLGLTATDGGKMVPDIASKIPEDSWRKLIQEFLR